MKKGLHASGGSNRVNRGGSWNNDPDNCRVANRNNDNPDNRNDNIGFRLANTGTRQPLGLYAGSARVSARPAWGPASALGGPNTQPPPFLSRPLGSKRKRGYFLSKSATSCLFRHQNLSAMLQIRDSLTLQNLLDQMVEVEADSFDMGGESTFNDAKPIHRVTLTRDFALCRYPVTQALWEAVMEDNPQPSRFKGAQRPVEFITWFEMVDFCNRLSEQQGLPSCYQIDGKEVSWQPEAAGYRLPTEAEWEYAARGGPYGRVYEYAGSPDLDQVGWYSANSNRETQPVGQKRPNELGLYDMSGNVFEWCWDWYDSDYYANSPEKNPTGPAGGSYRVLRGGSWLLGPDYCRVAYRYGRPDSRYGDIGFRLARTL